LLNQLGDVDELIVGGFHAMDCVKKIGEVAIQMRINTLVDLDLTDLFFNLYQKSDYFDIQNYSPSKYKEYIFSSLDIEDVEFIERLFNQNYNSPVYGFYQEKERRK